MGDFSPSSRNDRVAVTKELYIEAGESTKVFVRSKGGADSSNYFYTCRVEG